MPSMNFLFLIRTANTKGHRKYSHAHTLCIYVTMCEELNHVMSRLPQRECLEIWTAVFSCYKQS